jgi:hypothetical protein
MLIRRKDDDASRSTLDGIPEWWCAVWCPVRNWKAMFEWLEGLYLTLHAPNSTSSAPTCVLKNFSTFPSPFHTHPPSGISF